MKRISTLLYNLKYPGFTSDLENIWFNHFEQIDTLKKEQEKLLRSIIEHAFKTVPFYINFSKQYKIDYRDIQELDDLKILPIITKEDIVSKKENFFSNEKIKYINSRTGGSTGEPLVYRLSNECSKYNQLIKNRSWGIAGYKPGDMLCIFAGGSLYNKRNLRTDLINKLTNVMAFSSYGVTDNDLQLLYSEINSKKPEYFYGYASSWVILSEFMLRNNLSFDYKPNSLFSTSEVLLPEQRILIGDVMNVEVFDEYGLNDSGASAHECEMHEGKHIDFERSILQIIDESGRIIDNGTGRVIATSLRNYAMPFLRYDTGDIATITSEPCDCGRKTPRLLKIDGRTTDYLNINGVYIGSPVLTLLMGTFNVKTYRIIQENVSTVVFKLVVSTEILDDKEQRSRIEDDIRNSLKIKVPSANIEVYFFENMSELGIENKHKLIINKVKK